jgi:hypothetical protein
MDYEPVKHRPVVPAGYLRAWAHGRRIAMRLVGSREPRLIGVRDADVRSDYYGRERPGSDETIYDVERSLADREPRTPDHREPSRPMPLTNEPRGSSACSAPCPEHSDGRRSAAYSAGPVGSGHKRP